MVELDFNIETVAIVSLLLVASLYLYRANAYPYDVTKLPPGPKPLPFFGNKVVSTSTSETCNL